MKRSNDHKTTKIKREAFYNKRGRGGKAHKNTKKLIMMDPIFGKNVQKKPRLLRIV